MNLCSSTICLDGVTFSETPVICLYIEAMLQIGDWAARSDIGSKMKTIALSNPLFRGMQFTRLDRLEKRIKNTKLRGIIESKRGHGTRIQTEFL